MKVSVTMPQLGLTMEEGTVSSWLKKPGQEVKKDEPLFVLSTDKVEMEVEATVEGTMGEILVPEGETVRVGTLLAYVESRGAETELAVPRATAPAQEHRPEEAAAAPANATVAAAKIPRIPGAPPQGARSASPRARRLAQELGVDIAAVSGSGPGGRVIEDDVRRAAGTRQKVPQPVSNRRRLIAERLTVAQLIPVFSVSAEANAENLVDAYNQAKDGAAGDGLKVTVTDLLLNLIGRALLISPELNATWDENTVHERATVDIALAVGTEQGVIAPVIRNIEILEFPELVRERSSLVEKARRGGLSLTELEGAVGTLSNLGMHRVDQFQAMITPGQSFVLAAGRVRKRPWASDTTLVAKPTLMLTLTVDHRLADGVAAAAFLEKLVQLVEKPPAFTWESKSAEERRGRRSHG